ncbi:MAG: NrfD/PsrC family molybdoenzyme membrane anchor subunit [Tepidisphaeraceae bacterium]
MADSRKDFTSDAPWAAAMSHKADPNRVRTLQTPSPGHFESRPAAGFVPADPATSTAAFQPATGAAAAVEPNRRRRDEPSYYDVSMLKTPLWKWEIATYFFLGGLSAGAHVLGRVAGRLGHEDVSRVASYLALASILPGPPLLIHDLGDPKRFHHMLRVWKPSSPMNLGTWAITAYSGAATAAAVRAYLNQTRPGAREQCKLQKMLNNGTLLLVQDMMGTPVALMVAAYTGVLLSTTSNPLWCKNRWLSPMFTASAISTGAEAILLAMDCRRGAGAREGKAQKALRRLDTLSHLVELGCIVGFNKAAGEKAKAIHAGPMRNYHRASLFGIIGAEVLKLLPVPGFLRRPKRELTNALGLLGGFAMRWTMVMGGHPAASDPQTARLGSQPSSQRRP